MINKISWELLICKLQNKGLNIDAQINVVKKYLDMFGYEAIINNYYDKFIFKHDKTKFKNGASISGFINLFNLDRNLSRLLLSDILNIEKRFSSAILNNINMFLYNNICTLTGKNYEFWNHDLTLNDFINSDSNKKIFINLFNKHKLSEKHKILDFIKYLKLEKVTNSLETIDEKLNKFCSNLKMSFANSNKLKITFKSIFNLNNLSIYLEENNFLYMVVIEENYNELFNRLFDEFILKDITEIMLNNLSYDNYNHQTPIIKLSLKWTFGTWIKIFDSLNTNLKHSVVNYMFKYTDIKWNEKDKIPTFTAIMRIFQQIRNKCSHNESIYDFKQSKQDEIKKIVNFLILNDFNYLINSPKNSINLLSVIKCINIFDNDKISGTKTKIEKKTQELFEKYNIKLII